MVTSSGAAIPERFREMIAGDFGLHFDDAKLGFLAEILRRRAEARGLAADAYVSQLEANAFPDESGPLAEDLTVGESYFFRNNDQFRAFREVVIPERTRAHAATRTLRILSAGCSSGEEPYTLAMIARDAMPAGRDIAIRAIDLNPAALKRAAAARYSSWALRDTSAEIQRKWFASDGRELVLNDEVRQSVTFDLRNLADADSDIWQPGAYDAVFCRNVIMYFTPAVQQAVVARIARSLAPGGYLFLGHAETLRGLSQEFHLVHTHGTFYYQRRREGEEAPARHHVDFGASAPRAVFPVVPALPPATIDVSWFDAIGKASLRIAALLQPPDDPPHRAAEAPWNLGTALDLLRRERFADALGLLDELPPEARDDPDVLLLQAVLLVQDGKPNAAADVCRELLARDELNAGANYVLALCFEGAGERRPAVHHFGVAAYLDPAFAMPHLHLGLLARRGGNFTEARFALERALELLKREEAARLLLFGGGFTRDALIKLGEAELRASKVAA